jgi:hypothetical protein
MHQAKIPYTQCRALVRIGLGQGLKEENRFDNTAYFLPRYFSEVNENACIYHTVLTDTVTTDGEKLLF